MVQAPVHYRVKVRSDKWGDGRFGSPRGMLPDGSKKFHDGVDIVITPGDFLYAPITGEAVKVDFPYMGDSRWKGLQIENSVLIAEVWYMEPRVELIGQQVIAGVTRIGCAQDISKKYGVDPDKGVMTPHIHFRLSLKPFSYLVKGGQFGSTVIKIDPLQFIDQQE